MWKALCVEKKEKPKSVIEIMTELKKKKTNCCLKLEDSPCFHANKIKLDEVTVKSQEKIQKVKLFTCNETLHLLQGTQMSIIFLVRQNSDISGSLEVVGLLTRTDALK